MCLKSRSSTGTLGKRVLPLRGNSMLMGPTGNLSSIVTAPKLGYQFLCCYSFLALIFQKFLLSLLDDSDNSCHFQPFKTLLMSFSVGKTSFASAQILSNPNSKFLEFECGLCDYKGAIIFLDLLIIPSVPRDPSILLNLGYAKILPSPMQYF